MSQAKSRKKVERYAIVSFALSFLLCFSLIFITIRNRSDIEKVTMEQLVTEKSIKVNEVISKLLYKTQTLAALVQQTQGNFHNFDEIAATIVDDPAIKNVLIAPGGIVSNVYPLEGNEGVIGFDMLSDSAGNREALWAIERRELFFGGPFELIQGGQALVGRMPVFFPQEDGEDALWGLVSVTLHYPEALAGAELDSLPRQGFAYEIWRINPDDGLRQTIASSSDTRNLRYIEKQITILNADWYFRLSPVRTWYQYPETWVLLAAALLVSIMIGVLTQNNIALRDMKGNLEEMVQRDSLTGCLNRKGLFFEMNRLLRLEKRFTLYYMDLNDFKHINDTYGHYVGDKVLMEFARRMDRNLDGSHIFARLSGDEFVLLHVEREQPDSGMEGFWSKIDQEFEAPVCHEKGMGIYLSFSKGQASFPEDGTVADKILICADQRMYEDKKRHQNGKAGSPTPS